MTDITLTDIDSSASKVNSGVAIEMNASSLKCGQNSFTQSPNIPGKAISQTHKNLLSFGDQMGISDTVITIAGVFDLSTYTETTGGGTSVANTICLKFLLQIVKSGHIFTLTDKYSVTGSSFVYRTHSLTGTFPSETLTTMTVMCRMIQYETQINDSEEGSKISYTMELVEVRG